MENGQDVDNIKVAVGEGDKDKWVALIEGVKGIVGDHIDNKEDEVNATDNCHDAEASER